MRRDAKILSGIDFSPSVFFFLFPSKSISRLFIFIRDRSSRDEAGSRNKENGWWWILAEYRFYSENGYSGLNIPGD